MSLRKEEEICVIIISWILLMNTFPLPIGYKIVLWHIRSHMPQEGLMFFFDQPHFQMRKQVATTFLDKLDFKSSESVVWLTGPTCISLERKCLVRSLFTLSG